MQIFNAIFGSNPFLPDDISTGDQIEIPLGKLGNFTATVQKVTNDKVLFIFDDYVAKRPMNEDGGNVGGYDMSDLKKWIDTELYNMFPAVLKQRMTGLSIPTLGEICGWGDEWDRDHIEADGDEQLPLMKPSCLLQERLCVGLAPQCYRKGVFFGCLCRCERRWLCGLLRRFGLLWSSSGVLVG